MRATMSGAECTWTSNPVALHPCRPTGRQQRPKIGGVVLGVERACSPGGPHFGQVEFHPGAGLVHIEPQPFGSVGADDARPAPEGGVAIGSASVDEHDEATQGSSSVF